ncbi:phosphoglycerate kinase [Pseudoclavibacter sp. CFCC 13796]|uniref:phosphoglycerate kinase n=1 Tax=Pseudoclavibacter sp. CFCC 13796 TaxID=2615179 RepID=UPI0013013DBB|nr:phosphoglycerate kinase [Pseudoclavibacter sp. CFCC 13796]KAB1661805.1 phosphoglycerate kinase [Pseudoclavibacter sp. CFCC 13796]
MSLKTIESLGSLAGRRVIVRSDLNVPLKDGAITDDGRIRASLPTYRRLLEAGASLIIVAHLGRPKGQVVPELSLEPVAVRLGELLGTEVAFATDTVGDSARQQVGELGEGGVVLLENLRFNAAETSKDAEERRAFAAQLAAFGDAFVSDGFGVVHRKQASVYELATLLPHAAGLLIETELQALGHLLGLPEHPYTVVLGGAKVSDKLAVIDNLLPKVDHLLIGGGMVYTFLAARGEKIGKSLVEADQIDTVRGYLDEAERLGVHLQLPVDIIVADRFAEDAAHRVTAVDAIEASDLGADVMGLDIGPKTAEQFAEVIRQSKTVFWNGPMGVFEFAAFAGGTRAVARALTETEGYSVVGGGDSAAAARSFGYTERDFGHISTGGGAGLELLEGKALPGLDVLGWSAE